MIGVDLAENAIVFNEVKLAADQEGFDFVLDAAEIEDDVGTNHVAGFSSLGIGGSRSDRDFSEYIYRQYSSTYVYCGYLIGGFMSDEHRIPDDEEGKDTKPTITAVFRLLQDVESRLTARIDGTEARLNDRIDGVEARLNDRIDGVEARLNTRIDESEARLNSRMDQGFKEIGHKIDALNRRALQTEAYYEDLSERVGRLESKAS